MVAGELDMIREEEHRARKVATVMGEMRKAGHRTENVVGDGTSTQEGSDS